MEQFSLSFDEKPERRIFSVAELNDSIRAIFLEQFQNIWVSGEISGLKQAASGHCYFTLKEQDAQIRCVCFRSALRFMKFKPQDGLAVLARANLDLYAPRGEYQLIVEMLEPQGQGSLQLAFEQLKKRLGAEGLFDAARKRPLPRYPRRIGIVTSPSGAVIEDMLRILGRRFPGLHIRVYGARVQGEGSIQEVSAGIRYFGKSEWPDVVVVARGGGSLEDLWTFNEEAVARAIAESPAPVISAIGHETDFTIADFVADLRAPTPSAAAELLICTRQELLDQIAAQRSRMVQAARFRLSDAARRWHQQGVDRAVSLFQRAVGRYVQRVDDCDYRLRRGALEAMEARRRGFESLEKRLRETDVRLALSRVRHRLDRAAQSMPPAMRMRIARARGRFDSAAGQLLQLSPLRILERGYAIVQDEQGRILKEAAAAPVDSTIRVRLNKGRLGARVTETGE